MTSFKSFVEAIHSAVSEAADSLLKSSGEMLDRFFDKKSSTGEDTSERQVLVPKTVSVEYPTLDSKGLVTNGEVQVPLIAIASIGATKIEKATLTASFELNETDGEIQVGLSGSNNFNDDTTNCRLEIIISPQELPKGLELLVNGYNNILKRQIS